MVSVLSMKELTENEITMVAGGTTAEDVIGGGIAAATGVGAIGAAAEASTVVGAVLLGG
jgi:hypothetical protein